VTLEGVETAIVFGEAFEDVGSGGHQEMAGGEIPLGVFADVTCDDAQFLELVQQVVTARLVATLNLGDEPEKRTEPGTS